MTNEEKAKEIAEKTIDDASTSFLGWINEMSTDFCEWSALEMAEWKDEQPISELGGWHTEEPKEDGWYLVDTPDFPKNCHCVVAEWDNHAKSFYLEADDEPIDFNKWKLIERG